MKNFVPFHFFFFFEALYSFSLVSLLFLTVFFSLLPVSATFGLLLSLPFFFSPSLRALREGYLLYDASLRVCDMFECCVGRAFWLVLGL